MLGIQNLQDLHLLPDFLFDRLILELGFRQTLDSDELGSELVLPNNNFSECTLPYNLAVSVELCTCRYWSV